MNRKVNSADVARMAGVSQATVSYVLNGRADQMIREETRRKVLEASQALGYRPNLAARSLATGRTHMIALWVPYSFHSVFNHVIEQFMRRARESRFRLLIVQIHDETGETLSASGLLSELHVDGILALDATKLVNEILDDGHAPPIVSLGPAYSQRTDHVGIDLYTGSLQAVRHLREVGCRRVAYAGFQNNLHPGEPRYDAYVQAMQESETEPEFIRLKRGEYGDTHETIREYFAASDRPDGLFCWNDESAIGANRALADLGLRVPEDIALIGSDGIRETLYAVPTLSTMAQPFEAMCRTAWEFLQRRLREPDSPLQQALLPMRLEKRASTNRA